MVCEFPELFFFVNTPQRSVTADCRQGGGLKDRGTVSCANPWCPWFALLLLVSDLPVFPCCFFSQSPLKQIVCLNGLLKRIFVSILLKYVYLIVYSHKMWWGLLGWWQSSCQLHPCVYLKSLCDLLQTIPASHKCLLMDELDWDVPAHNSQVTT